MAPTWEGLQWNTSRIENNEYIDMIKEQKSWTNHRKNWTTNEVKGWITGKNCEMNEEQRDHELIREYWMMHR